MSLVLDVGIMPQLLLIYNHDYVAAKPEVFLQDRLFLCTAEAKLIMDLQQQRRRDGPRSQGQDLCMQPHWK